MSFLNKITKNGKTFDLQDKRIKDLSTDDKNKFLSVDENLNITTKEVDTSNKMNYENPTGIGSFSLNRKDDTTIGENSVAIGKLTEASGIASFAEGRSTAAIGMYSHAEGVFSESQGHFSHAEGDMTYAVGAESHSEGGATRAIGNSSHAEGRGTYISIEGGHAQGVYNVYDDNNIFLDIIGNGTDQNRSNASTTDKNGNQYLSGKVYIDCTDYTTKETGLNKENCGGTPLATVNLRIWGE